MSEHVKVYLVKAFGRGPKGGNPAGVVLDAGRLTSAQKQLIAKTINYSETAFVHGSDKADFALEFFTPTKQIPNCGHATVAAFSLLRQKKIITGGGATVETLHGVGSIRFEDETVFMEQRPVGRWKVLPAQRREVLSSLGLRRGRLLEGFEPCVVSTGNKFFLVGVRAESDLAKLRPDPAKILKLSARRKAVGFYVFAMRGNDACAATTRMFAPFYGINEESATGMAAGPLAWMLYDRLGVARDEFRIEQGRFMRPASLSRIETRVTAARGRVKSLLIGGRGFIASETTVAM